MVTTHSDARSVVLDWIESHKEEAIELLQSVVRIPSPNPPGDEKAVADFCAEYLREIGLSVEQLEPAPVVAERRSVPARSLPGWLRVEQRAPEEARIRR